MKLRRIEAQAFGLLKESTLGEFGDGLTVVLGPNEAGKTTYRELVRMVLYGFPDGRSKDKGYDPPGGTRSGRLVFEGPEGMWALARSGGKRGDQKVETIKGAERSAFLDEITSGVTDQTYRTVFGFGLAELSTIANSSGDSILAQLYGETVASGNDPMRVRKTLADSADGLLRPRGRAKLNETWDAMKDVRARIGDIRSSEREYASDQVRLKQTEAVLAAAREESARAETLLREIARDFQSARTLADSVAELEKQSEEAASVAETNRALAGRCVVDRRVLAIEGDLMALLEDKNRVRDKDEHARQRDELAAEKESKAASLGVPDEVHVHEGDRARLQAWQAAEAKLAAAAAQAEQGAQDAESDAAGEKAKAAAISVSGGPRIGPKAVAAALLVVGIAGVAAGVALSQTVAASIGALVAVLAAVMLLAGRGSLGAGLTHDAVRAEGVAAKARAQADAARSKLLEAQSEWEAWVTTRGLGARGTDVAAVQSLLDDAAKRDEHLAQAASYRREAEAARKVSAEWSEKLVALVRGPLGIAEKSPEPQGLAMRAKQELDRVSASRDEQNAALKEADAAAAQAEAAVKKAAGHKALLDVIVEKHAITGDPVAVLRELEEGAKAAAEAARETVEQALREHEALSTKLDMEGRDAALALAEQRLEGLRANAQEHAETYLVESLALRLMNAAIQRYEDERQPDVIRAASRIFGEMTGGRYEAVKVPMGMAEINVVNNRQQVILASSLSTGAQEQLYLALRVAYISSLGGLAPALPVLMDDIMANYDAERVDDAVSAVRELVKVRQVLFFTCHEATAQALSEGVSGSRILTLDRCAF